jgi:hypothetical protein
VVAGLPCVVIRAFDATEHFKSHIWYICYNLLHAYVLPWASTAHSALPAWQDLHCQWRCSDMRLEPLYITHSFSIPFGLGATVT